LGFFKLDDFLAAQRCSWIFRAHKNPIDNWRYDLHALSPNNNVLLLRSSDIVRERNPVLFGLALAYEKFYSSFSAAGGNYRNSYLFENSIFTRTERPHRLINKQFFGVDFYNTNKNIIRTLTFSDCFRNGHFKSLQEWQQDGCRLSINTWLGLRNAIMLSKGRLQNELNCENILEFSAKLKKGSKKIRKYFESMVKNGLNVFELQSFKTFTQLTKCTPTSYEKFVGDWISSWRFNPLPNDLKQFIYNSRFNSLPLNNRLHSYKPEVDPRCTFCRILDANSQERDNFDHCFFSCPIVEQLLQNLFNDLDLAFLREESRDLYWFGQYKDDILRKDVVFCYNLIFDTFRYVIFKFRCKFVLPSYDSVFNHIGFIIENICRCNKSFREALCGIDNLARLAPASG
jgi:hypothetical protein